MVFWLCMMVCLPILVLRFCPSTYALSVARLDAETLQVSSTFTSILSSENLFLVDKRAYSS